MRNRGAHAHMASIEKRQTGADRRRFTAQGTGRGSRRHFGSVRKLPSGRYQASYWHEGERHVAADTFLAKTDALAYLSSAETDVRRGAWIDPHRADVTVSAFAAQWMRANPAKRGSTLARDETILRRHVSPAIGERRIGAVTPQDIQGLVNSWVSKGSAPKTVRRQYGVARAVFAYAVAGDLLVRSPCRNVKLPAVRQVKSISRAFVPAG